MKMTLSSQDSILFLNKEDKNIVISKLLIYIYFTTITCKKCDLEVQ